MGDSELEKDITLMRNYEFYTFAKEMHKKYASKVREGRTLTPWKNYSLDFLIERLEEEFGELEKALEGEWSEDKIIEVSQECLDVANFCMFLWLYLNKRELFVTGD